MKVEAFMKHIRRTIDSFKSRYGILGDVPVIDVFQTVFISVFSYYL